MAFDVKNQNSNDHEDQLSLLDFKMQETDFTESAAHSQSDYHTWAMAHQETEAKGAGRFVTVSASVHIAIALLIAVMSVPLVEKTKTETITIEIEDSSPTMARGASVPATQGGASTVTTQGPEDVVATAVAPSTVVTADDIVVPENKPVAKALPKKSAPKIKAVVAKATAPARSVAPKTNFQAVPATIDDLDAPTLDEGGYAAVPVKATLDDDFSEDMDQVDATHQKVVAQEKNALESMASAFAAEQEDELGAVAEQAQIEASENEAAAADLRKRNAQAVASALAAEKAEADRAARAKAAAAASAAQARAIAAAAAAQNGHGNGQGQSAGQGAGNSGANQAQNIPAGTPQGVRSLDQLRQMPGNPRPRYDRDERLKGHQGEVAFLAYISKSGSVTQFRLMKSTGFRNLDSKTLAALKKWRFYPGQEGWVELPFKWDLKGGTEQDGGMLRAAATGY